MFGAVNVGKKTTNYTEMNMFGVVNVGKKTTNYTVLMYFATQIFWA
jgi:hypothetical protein